MEIEREVLILQFWEYFKKVYRIHKDIKEAFLKILETNKDDRF